MLDYAEFIENESKLKQYVGMYINFILTRTETRTHHLNPTFNKVFF